MRQELCPVLVGREEELRVLLEALDGAVAGRGTTVVVTGEAGAGKSRLVRELSGKAMGRGLPVLTGRAAGGAVPVPFRPLAEAVLGELRRVGLPDLPELRPFRPALGRLVPEWQPREPLGRRRIAGRARRGRPAAAARPGRRPRLPAGPGGPALVLTNTEIGGRLHLSPRTVEKHVASLLAKTGGQRRTQLAKYAAALSR